MLLVNGIYLLRLLSLLAAVSMQLPQEQREEARLQASSMWLNLKKLQRKPRQPASVLEAEDEPVSMFESTKVFIGKRHHQTEKPQDILEFFLKYWTDEGDTVLDPTMGSGSTGVACKKLGRNFIGYELDEKIFKVAEARIEK